MSYIQAQFVANIKSASNSLLLRNTRLYFSPVGNYRIAEYNGVGLIMKRVQMTI